MWDAFRGKVLINPDDATLWPNQHDVYTGKPHTFEYIELTRSVWYLEDQAYRDFIFSSRTVS